MKWPKLNWFHVLVFVETVSQTVNGADVSFWKRAKPIPPTPDDVIVHSWNKLEEVKPDLKFIVELREKKKLRQWIVSVEEGLSEPDERDEERIQTFYCSTGHSYDFSTKIKPLHLQTLGPLYYKKNRFSKKSKLSKMIEHEVQVPEDYLMLGFEQMASFSIKMQSKKKPDVGLKIGVEPYDREIVQKTRVLFEQAGISESDIRSVTGIAPSLNSFFNLIMETPGVSGILKEMIDRPSIISLMTKGLNLDFSSKGDGVAIMDPVDWGLMKGDACYQFPVIISLNGKPVLQVLLIITTPAGKYQNTAGVVGIIATVPDDEDRLLYVKSID